jgi:hypothetical protein
MATVLVVLAIWTLHGPVLPPNPQKECGMAPKMDCHHHAWANFETKEECETEGRAQARWYARYGMRFEWECSNGDF